VPLSVAVGTRSTRHTARTRDNCIVYRRRRAGRSRRTVCHRRRKRPSRRRVCCTVRRNRDNYTHWDTRRCCRPSRRSVGTRAICCCLCKCIVRSPRTARHVCSTSGAVPSTLPSSCAPVHPATPRTSYPLTCCTCRSTPRTAVHSHLHASTAAASHRCSHTPSCPPIRSPHPDRHRSHCQ